MPLRPPASLASLPAREAALGAIDAEVLAEQASSLARAGRRLEQALRTLADMDQNAQFGEGEERAQALSEAREAFWYLVVQREACGFGSSSDVLSAYGVPPEVSNGIAPKPIVWRRRR